MNGNEEQGRWWREGVVYQIYPRSFYDSNGDGIGDIPGITEKLDYIKNVGVNIIWLSPVYASPNHDNGYDISNYRDIMPEFGTLADWEELLRQTHVRGMKLIMDLVVNHTSTEHPWFLESRKDKHNKFRDYYIWRPSKNGGMPNNWESFFGGPAWELDETTGEYYLHLFAVQQADLNWVNPKVRREVYEIMEFWLDKGIDGFRMDVINLIGKAPGLPSVPPLPGNGGLGDGGVYYKNQPKAHEYVREMHREVLAGRDIMTVGETPGVSTEDALNFCGRERGELDMVFHFEHVDFDSGEDGYWSYKPFQLPELKRIIGKWQNDLYKKGWNSIYLNNHDQPRAVSRFCRDAEYLDQAAKCLGMMNFALSGTPYIYQGEELGMTNVEFDSIDSYRDIAVKNYYAKAKGQGKSEQEIMDIIHYRCRDNARTPMQWSDAENAGFTGGSPWIDVNPNYTEINAAAQEDDPDSVLQFYRRLVRFRKMHPACTYGSFELLEPDHPDLFAYIKRYKVAGSESLLVLLNFSSSTIRLPESVAVYAAEGAETLLCNYPEAESNPERTLSGLRPWEGVVCCIG